MCYDERGFRAETVKVLQSVCYDERVAEKVKVLQCVCYDELGFRARTVKVLQCLCYYERSYTSTGLVLYNVTRGTSWKRVNYFGGFTFYMFIVLAPRFGGFHYHPTNSKTAESSLRASGTFLLLYEDDFRTSKFA